MTAVAAASCSTESATNSAHGQKKASTRARHHHSHHFRAHHAHRSPHHSGSHHSKSDGSGGQRSRSGDSGSSTSSPGLSAAQQQALEDAKQYLQTAAFSRQGLIDQLDSSAGSGYSVQDATAAVDSLNVDWRSEAVQDAKQYLQTDSFSCQGLTQQLDSSAGSQFTPAQARYGAMKTGICGSGSDSSGASNASGPSAAQKQAIASARQYLQTSPFSKQGLIDQLDSSAGSGYSVTDATAAVNSLHVSWNSEAAQAAKQYLQTSPFSCQDLIEQLDSSAGSQFTPAQAQYGATKAGACS